MQEMIRNSSDAAGIRPERGQQTGAADVETITPPFDDARYYLGALCKRAHDWHDTGQSLRKAGNRSCIVCAQFLDRRATEKGRGKREFAKRNALIHEIKLERGCSDCGYRDHPAALHFDHLPGTEKVRAIARMGNTNLKSLMEEIAKCEVVCANCHAIRTANRRTWSVTQRSRAFE